MVGWSQGEETLSPLSVDTRMVIKERPQGTEKILSEKILSVKVKNRAVVIPNLEIPQRNTGESLGGLPEWGFESTYPDLKELGSPRGHVDYTTETQQSSFFG